MLDADGRLVPHPVHGSFVHSLESAQETVAIYAAARHPGECDCEECEGPFPLLCDADTVAAADRSISLTDEICCEFDTRTEPWATSDLAEMVECMTTVAITSLPGKAFDRWLACLATRDAAGLDYDSPERINARLARYDSRFDGNGWA